MKAWLKRFWKQLLCWHDYEPASIPVIHGVRGYRCPKCDNFTIQMP